METKWIEDFLSLAETGSFTRSAQARHLTQPAFSRRIQALESWLGADLIDRASYPTRLTPAGELFKAQAVAMLEQINAARALMRGQKPLPAEAVAFAVPHTLSLTFFPKWLAGVEKQFGPLSCRLEASNVHDAVMALVEGGCDLLMCYHHPQQPVELDRERYQGVRLGLERVRPYSRCNRERQPRYTLPGTLDTPLPFLGYAPDAYLRRMTDMILERAPCFLDQRYETDMAEGLKNMALEGHGIAFLPESTVTREVRYGQLAVAGGDDWSVQMDIRLYKDRKRSRGTLDALWAFLAGHYPAV